MQRHVVVTGSSGLVGRTVAERLTAAGHQVLGIDARPGRHTAVVGDLRRLDPAPLLRGGRAVVHVAALHAPHVGVASDADFRAVNVDATERLLVAARHAGVARFVLTSTTSIYGHALAAADRAAWVDERLEPEPRDIYDDTKLAAEALVRSAHGDDLTTVSLRVARCFPEEPRSTVVHRLSRGVDVRDVADGFLRAVEATVDDHVCVNAGGPLLFAPEDRSALLADPGAVLDRRIPWLRAAFAARRWALPDRIDRVYDSTSAGRLLGHHPRRGVADALASVTGHARADDRNVPTAC